MNIVMYSTGERIYCQKEVESSSSVSSNCMRSSIYSGLKPNLLPSHWTTATEGLNFRKLSGSVLKGDRFQSVSKSEVPLTSGNISTYRFLFCISGLLCGWALGNCRSMKLSLITGKWFSPWACIQRCKSPGFMWGNYNTMSRLTTVNLISNI